jgi:hypothetical protein
MLLGFAARLVPAGVHYGSAGTGKARGLQLGSAKARPPPLAGNRERPPGATGGRSSARSLEEDKRMSIVSPGSPGTPDSGEPPRLPVRWAVIIGVTAAAGIACFPAGGIVAAVAAATAVAVALHELLV